MRSRSGSGQQDQEAPARGGAGPRRGRRHADHVRRDPVEPRAGHGVGRGPSRARVRARRERHAAGEADRERAPRSIAGRRTCATSGRARRAPRRWTRRPRSFARQGRRPSSFRSARPRRSAPPRMPWRSTELLAQGPAPDCDHPLDFVRRHAGRHHRRLPPARTADHECSASAPTIRRPRLAAKSGGSSPVSRS